MRIQLADGSSRDMTAEEIANHQAAVSDLTNQAARSAIMQRLGEIDAEAIRPLRAGGAGTATADDTAKIADLEAEAVILRAQLGALDGGASD